MSAGLMHLVAHTPTELTPQFELPNTVANTLATLNINDANLLPRNGDLFKPEYLIIDLTSENRHQEAHDIIKNCSFILEGNGNEIIAIPFSIMHLHTPAQITPSRLKITINFEYFFGFTEGFIPIIQVPYTTIRPKIKHNLTGTINQNIRLIGKFTFLDNQPRRLLALTTTSILSRNFHKINIISNTASKQFNIYGCGYLQGILMKLNTENSGIDNIASISFTINGHIYHSFTRELVELYCERIENNLLYIPMNLNTTMSSPMNTNGLSLGRIDEFKMTITTNLDMGFDIDLNFMMIGNVKIMSGMIGNQIITDASLERLPHIIAPRPEPVNNVPVQQMQRLQWTIMPINFDIPAEHQCPITYEPINLTNDGIYKCDQCANLFSIVAFVHWMREGGRNCPMCRFSTINTTYYTENGEPIENVGGIPVSSIVPAIQLPEDGIDAEEGNMRRSRPNRILERIRRFF